MSEAWFDPTGLSFDGFRIEPWRQQHSSLIRVCGKIVCAEIVIHKNEWTVYDDPIKSEYLGYAKSTELCKELADRRLFQAVCEDSFGIADIFIRRMDDDVTVVAFERGKIIRKCPTKVISRYRI